jgi:hypothetical protein
LPLFPALALLMADAWHALSVDSVDSLKLKRWFSIASWGLVLAVLIAGGVFIWDMEALLPREAKGIVAGQANVVAVALMVVGLIVSALLLHRKNVVLALVGQVITMALVVVVALHGIVPNFSHAAQGTMLKYLAKTNGQPLMLYEIQRPSLTFYGKRRVPRYVEEDYVEIERELHQNQRTFVITKNHHLEPFYKLIPSSLEVSVLEKDPVYSLLSVSKVSQSPTRNH